jgi:uncharacterized protein
MDPPSIRLAPFRVPRGGDTMKIERSTLRFHKPSAFARPRLRTNDATRLAAAKGRLHNRTMTLLQGQREKIAEICRRYHVRRLSLFGSTATGTERPDSDVDLLVEFVPGEAPSGFALVDMQEELAQVFNGRRIDLAFPSVLRNPWRRKAIEAQLQPVYQ